MCNRRRTRIGRLALSALVSLPSAIGADGVGLNDTVISTALEIAAGPSLAYNSKFDQFLVAWVGYDDAPGASSERYLYGRLVDGATGDFLSHQVTIGPALVHASSVAVAYDPVRNRYLAAWHTGLSTGLDVDGQLIDAADLSPIGAPISISDTGPGSTPVSGSSKIDVAYDSRRGEFLVVWVELLESAAPIEGERQVFGQRLNGDGVEIGEDDFQITDQDADGAAGTVALVHGPKVTFNPLADEYLLVWVGPVADSGLEVLGQRLEPAGLPVGETAFRISDMGPEGAPSPGVGALEPDVVFNEHRNEYLVVWTGLDEPGAVFGPFRAELYGQRLRGDDGVEIGANDFRLSEPPVVGGSTYTAQSPRVAYNTATDLYHVAWLENDSWYGEIGDMFTRTVAGSGAFLEPSPVWVNDDLPGYEWPWDPDVAARSHGASALFVWQGDNFPYGPHHTDFYDNEVFGQRYEMGQVALEADRHELSVALGGKATFRLRRPDYPGHTYFLIGSTSGAAPGLVLGGVEVPLVFDGYSQFIVIHPGAPPLSGALGVLDGAGEGSAEFTLPVATHPSLAGLIATHAFLVFDSGFQPVYASNPVAIRLTP